MLPQTRLGGFVSRKLGWESSSGLTARLTNPFDARKLDHERLVPNAEIGGTSSYGVDR